MPNPQKLGERLVDRGIVSRDQLAVALREQQVVQEPLGRLIVRLGFASESHLREILSDQFGRQGIDLANFKIAANALSCLAAHNARALKALPLSFDESGARLRIACAHPNDLVHTDRIRQHLPQSVQAEFILAGEADLASAIDRHYGESADIDALLSAIESHGGTPPNRHDIEAAHPVIRLVDALLAESTRAGASDLHFEPEAGYLRIRQRIDGILHTGRCLHHAYWPAISVRLKVLAGMNIAESRLPQDGQFSQEIAGRRIDFRCATQPTLHGENIVLRLLDRQRGIVPLDALRLPAENRSTLTRMLARPEGLILLTGPTGSGKTTTLYSLIQQLNSDSRNIMTLEDPVEYPLPLVRQTSLSGGSRLDFAGGIRALMRQDPDIILVGEIRDGETAEMALRAAMTGHLVLSTLHSNSALGALPRLFDLGVRRDILADNLNGVIAQRLLRKLCPDCRVPDDTPGLTDALHSRLGNGLVTPFRAKGCPTCQERGYRGRQAIWEILAIDAPLQALISDGAGNTALAREWQERGGLSLAKAALQRIADGTTDLAEARRVVDLGNFACTQSTP